MERCQDEAEMLRRLIEIEVARQINTDARQRMKDKIEQGAAEQIDTIWSMTS
jgi:hypothetical protein